MNSNALPPVLSAELEKLHQGLVRAGNSNVEAIVLYGGAARGRYHAGQSDVNLLLLVRDASISSLSAMAPALNQAWRAVRVDPLIILAAELAQAAAAFPTKFLEIRRHHLVLVGSDPLAKLDIPSDAVRARLTQELWNLSLRLRRRFLAAHLDSAALLEVIKDTVVPLSVALENLLEIENQPMPAARSRAEMLQAAAGAFGLDAATVEHLVLLRGGGSPAIEPAKFLEQLLALLSSVTRLASRSRGAG